MVRLLTTLQCDKFYEILRAKALRMTKVERGGKMSNVYPLSDRRWFDNFYVKKAAFTLVEVLIVIGIIGIVAAMTLPNMYTNFKKRQTVTGLQVAYSMFSQAIKQSVAENGEVGTWDFSVEKNVPEKYIVPYLAGTTKLKTGYNMRTLYQHGQTGYTYSDWSWNINTRPLYSTPKGMVFNYANANDGYPTLVVDVNGVKSPNIMGIDGFTLWIDKESSTLVLAGSKCSRNSILLKGGNCKYTTTRHCVRDSHWQYYRGGYCGAVIQKDGWKISDDYPWGNGGLTPVEK